MTSVTEIQTASARLFAGTWRPWRVLLQHSVAIIFDIECDIARFLSAMRVFEVRTSSSSRRLPLCKISFLSRPPLLS